MDDGPETVAALRLTVATLRLENGQLRLALGSALLLEKFWRYAALLGNYPPEPEPEAPPKLPRKYGEGHRAMRPYTGRRKEPS